MAKDQPDPVGHGPAVDFACGRATRHVVIDERTRAAQRWSLFTSQARIGTEIDRGMVRVITRPPWSGHLKHQHVAAAQVFNAIETRTLVIVLVQASGSEPCQDGYG